MAVIWRTVEPVFKQATEKAQTKVLCDVCGKPVASGKAQSNVTRFLFWESRCQCDRSKIKDSPFVSPEPVSASRDVRSVKLKSADRPAVMLRVGPEADSSETFANALKFIPSYYRPIEVLGEGGMGMVLKVEDTTDGKLYAIKLLRASFLDDQSTLRRFEKEAEAAMLLHHPGIVSAREYGLGQGQVPYMVMDFVEGESLAERLKRGPIPINEALPIFIAIAEALEYAHDHGVIHRDIKPSNVMLVTDAETGQVSVKLVDFGIARIILSGKGSACSLTQTGEVFGSPHYMSPEQCLGEESDASSDIYAFSCLMYECVSGRTPFVGSNPVKIILSHLEENPPSLIDVLKNDAWYRKVAAEKKEKYRYLSLMLAHGLEKDRKYRYDTTPYVLSQLRNCAKGNMRLYYIPSSKRKDTDRKAITATAITAVFLTVLSSTMWYGFSSSGSTDYGKFALDGDYQSMDGERLFRLARDYAGRGMWNHALRISQFSAQAASVANNRALMEEIAERRSYWQRELSEFQNRIDSLKSRIAKESDPTNKAILLHEYGNTLLNYAPPSVIGNIYHEAIKLQGVDPIRKASICSSLLNLKSKYPYALPKTDEIAKFAEMLLNKNDTDDYHYREFLAKYAQQQHVSEESMKYYDKAFAGVNPKQSPSLKRLLSEYANTYYNELLRFGREKEAASFSKTWHVWKRRY